MSTKLSLNVFIVLVTPANDRMPHMGEVECETIVRRITLDSIL